MKISAGVALEVLLVLQEPRHIKPAPYLQELS